MYSPSISMQGKNESFELQVARGQVPGHRSIFIWGYNPDVDTAEETVWTQGGILPHPSAASVMKVSSTSSNDAPGQTGALSIFVEGLDANYEEVSEIVVLNGQTAVNTVNEYLRIQFLTVVSAGASGPTAANAGNIYIGTGDVTGGVPANIFGHIAIGESRSLTAHWTVPARHKAFITHGTIGAGAAVGAHSVSGRLKIHTPQGIALTAAVVKFANEHPEFPFSYPIEVPEKSCISATAVASTDNMVVSASFNILLVEIDPKY